MYKVHIYYEDIYIDTISSNFDLTLEELLNLIDFDEDHFLKLYDMDMLDYNEFNLRR